MSRLKLSVMLPFVAFVAVLSASVSTIEYRKFERESTRISLETRSAVDTSFRASIAAETAMLQAVAESIAANQEYKAVFRQGDRARLQNLTAPLFEKIHQTGQVTHLYFDDAQRMVFLRAHQPDRFGDVVSRHTALLAEAQRIPASGVELGPLGTLTLRVVVPWFDGPDLIGYVETGKEIDNLLVGLREQFNMHPLLFLPKKRLDRAGWENGMAMLGRRGDWDEFPGEVLSISDDMSSKIIRPFLDGRPDHVQDQGHWYSWLRISLPNADGSPAATIGMVRDVTAMHDELARMAQVIALIALLGSAVVIALFWIIIDRVERQLDHTRDQLAQREATFHELFSHSKVVMLLIDPVDGAILDASDEAVKFYGYDRARLLSMRMSEINTFSRYEIDRETAQADSEGRCFRYFRHRLANGELREVEDHSGPITADNRVLLYSIIHDVTDRHRLEEERKRLVMAIEQCPVGIIITDPSGSIEYANPAFSRITGYGNDEILGQNPRILKSGESSDDEYRAMWANLTAGQPWWGAFRNRRKNGDLYWEQAHVSPMFDDRGQVTHYIGLKEDVSERRRAEESLKNSEERFRSLIEGTTDWIWESDDQHRFTWMSSGVEAVLGVSASTLIGARRWDLASESQEIDPSRWQAYIADLAAHRRFRDFRYWFKAKGGEAKWISVSGAPRFDENGDFQGYRGCGSDVTAFATISLRLRTMSKVVEQSPVSVVITDPHGLISYVNPHFSVVTGYASKEVLGQNSSRLSSGETLPEIYQEMWTTITSGGTWAGEVKNRRKDGSLHWEQLLIFPVNNDEGELVNFVSIKEDVTARKEAEERVLEQMWLAEKARRRTDLLLTSAGEGIFGVDTRGNLVFVNPAAQQMLGYTDAAELVGRNAHAITGHRLADGSPCSDERCAVALSLRDGIARRSDADTFQRRNGPLFPVEFSVTTMTEDGSIAGAVVVFHDITERRAAELALSDALRRIEHQAAKLSEINGELEQFAYVASHDLRQPLRMISSYLSLIDKKIGADLSDDLKRFFGFAVDGAKRMDRLILDLLEYSRTGRNADLSETVPLSEIITESLLNLEVAIEDTEGRVTVAEEFPTVQGNPAELVRLFQNLIGNAVKYRAPDRKPVVDVGFRPEGHEWVLWVRDNGIGVAPADHDRAFQIFQRLVSKEQYEGTGIGLAVCKKIVTNHGGRIWIESTLGEGSCFYFTLPRLDKGRLQ